MKKVLTILAAALAISVPSFAATTQTVNVSASVDTILDMSMAVFKLDVNGNPTGSNLGTNMSFGQLVRDNVNGVMHGADAYTVYLSTNTSSRPYTIKANMPALSNGATTLPPAMVCTVVSAKAGANDITGDSFPSASQNAIMSNSTIYTSNSAGQGATVQVVYGISGGGAQAPFTGWQPILLEQAAGSYTSSLVYTIALS